MEPIGIVPVAPSKSVQSLPGAQAHSLGLGRLFRAPPKNCGNCPFGFPFKQPIQKLQKGGVPSKKRANIAAFRNQKGGFPSQKKHDTPHPFRSRFGRHSPPVVPPRLQARGVDGGCPVRGGLQLHRARRLRSWRWARRRHAFGGERTQGFSGAPEERNHRLGWFFLGSSQIPAGNEKWNEPRCLGPRNHQWGWFDGLNELHGMNSAVFFGGPRRKETSWRGLLGVIPHSLLIAPARKALGAAPQPGSPQRSSRSQATKPQGHGRSTGGQPESAKSKTSKPTWARLTPSR